MSEFVCAHAASRIECSCEKVARHQRAQVLLQSIFPKVKRENGLQNVEGERLAYDSGDLASEFAK